MQLGYTILYVTDVPATLTFYEQAFGLRRRFVDDTGQYGELETGTTRLAFSATALVRTLLPIPFDEASPAKSPPPFEIGLVTDDVDAAFRQAVAAGATALKEPAQKPWGQRVGYVRDLNGFLVEICSPMP